jgi:hypothetical protein
LAAIVEFLRRRHHQQNARRRHHQWNRAARTPVSAGTEAEAVGQHITLIIPPERRAEEDEVLAKSAGGVSA